jgi:DNA-binding GntR family transcriptional regulator
VRILQAVKAHDREQARQSMIDHLRQIREDSTQ